MEISLSGACRKEGTISHTCEKPGDQCLDGFSGFDGVSTSVGEIGDGYKTCQIVGQGGLAEFLLKDGNADGACGSATKTFGGVEATCKQFPVKSCTGGGNIGKECVWEVEAPMTCATLAGSGGDPHIKKWDGHRFAYHGECDLLLVHSDDFGDKAGLDVHIRTTLRDFYSFIESAALRIGDSVLEVGTDSFWVDGIERSDQDLPMDFGGYYLNAPYQERNAKVYRVDLGNGDYIKFSTYKFFISVDIAGLQQDFESSFGLLGDYNSGAMIARDGQSIIESADDFGTEWQIQADERVLFRDARAPQLPNAKCVMPQTSSRRQIASTPSERMAAEQACSHKSPADYSFCVSDVLTTGDIGMAGAW